MRKINLLGSLLGFVLVSAVSVLALADPASAFVVRSDTGGDGYTPIVRKMTDGTQRVFTIFHHVAPSGTATPNTDINCVVVSSSQICPGYPKYFSSTVGTSNTGPADIATTYHSHYAQEGSKVYYAAQRTNDNGIGCFDLEAGTNCAYTVLGSLPMTARATRPAAIEGVERVGNKLYSVGIDVQAYCYDLDTAAACVGQPYDVGAGDATMPNFDGDDFRAPVQAIGTNFYFVVNYWGQSTPANARLACFDTLTNARCAGWATGVALTGTSTASESVSVAGLFASYTTSGVANAVCTIGSGPVGPSCWSLASGASASVPTGLLSGLPASSAREETRLGNKTYFAFYQNPGGFAECYDFTTQARCTGFGSPHTWPTVNGGDTRDYGYTYSDAGCFYGTGDTGELWSFDPVTGSAGDTSCPTLGVATATPVVPGIPNTGSDSGPSRWQYLALLTPVAVVVGVLGYRYTTRHARS
jgi:hypothetical protein